MHKKIKIIKKNKKYCLHGFSFCSMNVANDLQKRLVLKTHEIGKLCRKMIDFQIFHTYTKKKDGQTHIYLFIDTKSFGKKKKHIDRETHTNT